MPSYPPGMPLNARQRAAMNLQNAYGMQAGPQIAQLQQGNMSRVPMQQPLNMVKQEDQKPSLASLSDYSHQNMPQPQLPPIKSSQSDGASEALLTWQEQAARRRNLVATHRGEADRLMRDQFLQMQSRMEGGGLMMPLDEQQPPRLNLKRKIPADTTRTSSSIARAQGDATGEDDKRSPEEEDEDAINSDLDDPDDQIGNGDEEENTDQVMLCTYDKVQRVKNKWKCTLKDGILKVEGNE